MTNILRSSAPKTALVAALVVASLCGCGPSDGSKELADARAAYEVHNLDKATKLLEKSLECAPNSVDALVWLTRVKLELGELADAKKLVARATALSQDADVRMLAAQIAWHAKDYDAAESGFQAIADDAKQTTELRAQAWAGIGVVEMSQEHSHAARVAFLRALKLNFRDAAARYHLGLLYRDGFGYYEAALEQLQIYSRLDEEATPRVQKVKQTMIPSLMRQIAADAASRNGAARRDSSAAAAAIARAATAEKAGKIDTARKEYESAYKFDPLSAPAALGLARCWQRTKASGKRGGTADPQGRALDYYQAACALQPSKVATFLTAGKLALDLNQAARAEVLYSRALAAKPTSLDAVDGLIRALTRQGKSKTAKVYQQYRDALSKK